MKTIYKENCIIFGRVICTTCGSDTNLITIEKTITTPKMQSWEDVICKECWDELPSAEDKLSEIEEEITEKLSMDEINSFESFDQFWSSWERRQTYIEEDHSEYSEFYRTIFYKLRIGSYANSSKERSVL